MTGATHDEGEDGARGVIASKTRLGRGVKRERSQEASENFIKSLSD
jgi:hypothetical protein